MRINFGVFDCRNYFVLNVQNCYCSNCYRRLFNQLICTPWLDIIPSFFTWSLSVGVASFHETDGLCVIFVCLSLLKKKMEKTIRETKKNNRRNGNFDKQNLSIYQCTFINLSMKLYLNISWYGSKWNIYIYIYMFK